MGNTASRLRASRRSMMDDDDVFRSLVARHFLCVVCVKRNEFGLLVCPAEIRKICLLFGHFVAVAVVRYVDQVPSEP